jgi:hypothetical protein
MTDDDVIEHAAAEGFELVERPVGAKWYLVRTRKRRAVRAFGERRLAISFMRNWVRRGGAFA